MVGRLRGQRVTKDRRNVDLQEIEKECMSEGFYEQEERKQWNKQQQNYEREQLRAKNNYDNQYEQDRKKMQHQMKIQNQGALSDWYMNEIAQKHAQAKKEKEDNINFHKNNDFSNRFSSGPLPQHKNFLKASNNPDLNQRRIQDFSQNWMGQGSQLQHELEAK